MKKMPSVEESSKQLNLNQSNEYINQRNSPKKSNSLEYISLQDKYPPHGHHEGEYIDHSDLHNQQPSSTYLELEEAENQNIVNNQIEEYYSRINYASIKQKATLKRRIISLTVIVALIITVLLVGSFINRKKNVSSSFNSGESVLSLSQKHCTDTETANACRADFKIGGGT